MVRERGVAEPLTRGTRATGQPVGRVSSAERRAGYVYLVIGLVVAGLWLVSLPGAFEDGLLTYAGTASVGNIPFFHLVAELTMAVTALAAGYGLIRGARGARPVALVASGMLVYSSLNSSGWLLHHQPAVLVVTTAALAGSMRAPVVLAKSGP